MKDVFPIRNTNCIAKFLGVDDVLPIRKEHNQHPINAIVALEHLKSRELEPKNKLKCDYCGRRNNIENELCLSCGAPLEDKINIPQMIWEHNGEEIKL